MLKNFKKLLFQNQPEIIFKNIEWKNQGLNFKPFTIAQISDLHITKGNIDLLENTIELINSLHPDIIVITGDVICHGKKFIPDLINCFKKLKANYGKYACLGNHDHSDGDDGKMIISAYNKSNFRILVNESEIININGFNLHIAGADDIELGEQNIEKMIKKIPEQAKSIFLIHNPINFEDFYKHSPDLVLAGHTHGGQLYLPAIKCLYNILSGIKHISGMYKYDDSCLYVNRGLGTALLTPEIFNKKFYINTPRINANPEITFFTIKSYL